MLSEEINCANKLANERERRRRLLLRLHLYKHNTQQYIENDQDRSDQRSDELQLRDDAGDEE